MLNYILPPIIIIACTAVLIMFLFRKTQQIPAQELLLENATREPRKRTAAITSAMGQFGLKILERVMQWLKLMALKFHNMSNDWFHSIHERRERRSRLQQEVVEKNRQNDAKIERRFSEIINPHKKQMQSEQFSRPLVREKAVIPQQVKEKNKLEDALIRRIAVNPKDIEAYERLGDYYLESQNFQDSLECFKQVLRLSPINYKARLKVRRLEKLIK
jgi:tetratricopeptide (TPR) repeat protein